METAASLVKSPILCFLALITSQLFHATNFGYDAPPPAHTDCRCGGGEAGQPLGTGVSEQFSLAGKPAFFLAGNRISEE